MTDVDPTDTAAELEPAAGPWVSPLPPPPADGRPAPEEWLVDYLRGECSRTGFVVTAEEFASMVVGHQLCLQYPGRYVITRRRYGIRDDLDPDGSPVQVCYTLREEVLFHSLDREACDAYIRSRPEEERRSLAPRYVDDPNELPAGLAARLS